jgi:ribosomal protein L11 methyltransferase
VYKRQSIPWGPFDVVLANINRNILINDMASYARVLKGGGHLVLSGFYSEDRPMLLEHGKQFSLEELRYLTQHNWTAILLEKK